MFIIKSNRARNAGRGMNATLQMRHTCQRDQVLAIITFVVVVRDERQDFRWDSVYGRERAPQALNQTEHFGRVLFKIDDLNTRA